MVFVISALLIFSAVLATIVFLRAKYISQISKLQSEVTGVSENLRLARSESENFQEELRKQIQEAKERERDASLRAVAAEAKTDATTSELKQALQDKAQALSEATRVEEMRRLVSERDESIVVLNRSLSVSQREKTEALKDAEAAHSRAEEMLATEREAHRSILAGKDDQIDKLNEFIAKAKEALTTEFKAISAGTLKDVSSELLKAASGIIDKHEEKTVADVKFNQQRIETMLKPVEETIKRLDKHVEDSNLARTKAEALLDAQVRRLAGASESLTTALRKPVIRGSWGEMTLENALESAGLESEIDYVLQHSTDAEDGRRRTDAVINLPKGRKLIIDSKNLMESYLALAGAEDEDQRALLADAHSRSLRSHIKALSSKEYWRRYDGLDCVILFIPHDGMYHAAIKDEAELIREASEKRVFISNPMSLIPLLKAIRFVLDQERLNKSAEEISLVGAELYGEITRFAENMAALGKKIKETVKAYNSAVPGLDRFLVSKSRRLKQLGTAKGSEAELPETIEMDPRLFSSPELRDLNHLLESGDTATA